MKAYLYLLLLLTNGCTSHSTILTILPPEDGDEVGGVASISEIDGKETLYYQVGQSGNTRSKSGLKSISDDRIAELLSILPMPPKPKIFIIVYSDGSARMAPGALDQIRNEFSRWPGAELFIEGHTDSTGDEEMNEQISRARAQAVADEFRSSGIPVDEANVVGRGERAARELDGDGVQNELFRSVIVTIR